MATEGALEKIIGSSNRDRLRVTITSLTIKATIKTGHMITIARQLKTTSRAMIILLDRHISSHTINIQTNTVRLRLISTISLTLCRLKAMAMTTTKVRFNEGIHHIHLSPAINLSMKATMPLQVLHPPILALTLHSLLRESLWTPMIPILKIAA
jgi:hypothetical protein